SAYQVDLDSIATGLANIFPQHDKQWFRDRMEKGRKRGSKGWPIMPGHAVTYVQYLQCKELPLFREEFGKGGFNGRQKLSRKGIFGFARRLLGDYRVKRDTVETTGLEHCYDSLLCGQSGSGHTEKVLNNVDFVVDVPAHNGHDIVTTIDSRLQDVAEKAITNKMREIGADKGIVILMEVATGDVKAMVNMTRYGNEAQGYVFLENDLNYAVNGRWEPGSTFKTASMMVAMEDGYITPDYIVDTENGTKLMHGSWMKDHNASKGNSVPRVINVTNIMKSSSNVGVSSIIDKFYYEQPEKYVAGLYKIGVGVSLGMPMGADPEVRMPKKTPNGRQYTNWSKTTLPWMSIGYETKIPPISTLAFYNAIANGGRMMRPRFVTAELEEGKVVREFPPVCLKESICKPQTLRYIHDILDSVVNAPNGTGAKAGNPKFRVCGKTGTAQMNYGRGQHAKRYLVSFCGFYPSEAPKYSCIVCIEKEGPAYGGSHCGPVFKEISQAVMNIGTYRDPRMAADSTSRRTPLLATGRAEDTRSLLTMMRIPWQESKNSQSQWTTTQRAANDRSVNVHTGADAAKNNVVPNVMGMGARDAVYALRQAGLHVKVHGHGQVNGQSIPAGTKVEGYPSITINLN
ncbi:MAG: PASTA domain-containing protein, partial [Bacteroidaceae bacterium]|nr:PASTA domain-containing protein [Bacteroidaceae bacterium]